MSYEDMLAGRSEGKKDYKKLLDCCKQARRDGLHRVWIDACCINKASSAELSEAITSMFRYCERSKVCYVFLNDFLIDLSVTENLRLSSFSRSVWFTRGWTLQELIAPPYVKFFDASWSFLEWKTDESLSAAINSVTNIDIVVLNDPTTTKLMSISKKMSWAARRKTTRIEGHHAFIRLQDEIMRTSNDHTIFAWTSPPVRHLDSGFEHVSTMLALSSDQFEHSFNFKPFPQREYSKLDYTITNAGLAIRLSLQKIIEIEGLYAAFLACTDSEDRITSAILLGTTVETPAGHFWRTNCNEGPIERSLRRWFPISNRETIDANDVYVLLRFTPISMDNIEPSWSRVDFAKTRLENIGNISSGNTAVLDTLSYVPDPSFGELISLRQKHHLISTNRAGQLIDLTNTRLRVPKTIPFPRNRKFYGRAAVLQQLKDMFFPPDVGLRIQGRGTTSYTISGMGGIGKTQVAVEFCYDCIENHLFDAVIWIPARTIEGIHGGFQRVASKLKLAEQGFSTETIVRKVLSWLSDFDQHTNLPKSGRSAFPAKWLLVFDSADDVTLLEPFWPSNGPGCVLITSRNLNSWFQLGSENIALEPFTIQESSQFFSNITRIDGDFTALVEQLAGLPLAIVQAASFIVETGLSIEEYSRMFDKAKAKLLNRPSHQSYEHTLATVWSGSLSQLSPSTRGILQVISFLNPDFIQDSILFPSRTVMIKELPWNESDLLQSWIDLGNVGLIKRSPDRSGLQIHRLVQKAVIENMDPREYQKALSTAVTLVSSAWIHAGSGGQSKLAEPKICDNLLPYVFRLKDFASEMIDSGDNVRTKTVFHSF